MNKYKTSWQLRKVITHRRHYYYGEHKTKIVVLRNGREIPSDLQHHLNQIAQFFKTDPTTRKWWYRSEATLMKMAIASFESHLYLYGKSLSSNIADALESVHRVSETEIECCNRRLCDTCDKCIPCCNRLNLNPKQHTTKGHCYCTTPGCYTDKCPNRITSCPFQEYDQKHYRSLCPDRYNCTNHF